MSPKPAEDTKSCNCAHLRRAARQIGRFYDACLAGTGLRATQFTLLSNLRGQGPLPVGRLAQCISADRATMGHNLRPLARDGLVRVKQSDADRRVRVVSLTAKGEATLEAALPGWRRAQSEFEKRFGPGGAQGLRVALESVVETGLGVERA